MNVPKNYLLKISRPIVKLIDRICH